MINSRKRKNDTFGKFFDAYVTIVSTVSITGFIVAIFAAFADNILLKNQIIVAIMIATLSVPVIAFMKVCYDETVARMTAKRRKTAKRRNLAA